MRSRPLRMGRSGTPHEPQANWDAKGKGKRIKRSYNFSVPYKKVTAKVKENGWPVYEREAGHFHMLVDELAVTDLIFEAVNKLF